MEEAFPATSTYTLELPETLVKQRLHNKFHISLLCPYEETDVLLFPNRSAPKPYDFGAPPDAEFFVEGIEDHEWRRTKIWFHVWWTSGNEMFKPLKEVKDLKALDEYLKLKGVKDWEDLPKPARATPKTPAKRA